MEHVSKALTELCTHMYWHFFFLFLNRNYGKETEKCAFNSSKRIWLTSKTFKFFSFYFLAKKKRRSSAGSIGIETTTMEAILGNALRILKLKSN